MSPCDCCSGVQSPCSPGLRSSLRLLVLPKMERRDLSVNRNPNRRPSLRLSLPAPTSTFDTQLLAYSRFSRMLSTDSFSTCSALGVFLYLSGTLRYDCTFVTIYDGRLSRMSSRSELKKSLPLSINTSTRLPLTVISPPFFNSTPGSFLISALSIEPSGSSNASALYVSVSPSI